MGLFDDLFGNPADDRRREVKEEILDRLEMPELKRLLRDYGVGEPSKTVDDWLMGRRERTLSREHFVVHAMTHLKLDQIIAWCEKRKLRISDLVAKLDEKTKGTRSPTHESPASTPPRAESHPPVEVRTSRDEHATEFHGLLRDIEEKFEPEEIRNEEDLEKQLVQRLKIHYPGAVERQVATPKGRIDIVVKGTYALEIKIADRNSLRSLIGQALVYKEAYPALGVVIADTGRMPRPEIQDFLERLGSLGVSCVVLDGVRHRPRKKGTRATIRLH